MREVPDDGAELPKRPELRGGGETPDAEESNADGAASGAAATTAAERRIAKDRICCL